MWKAKIFCILLLLFSVGTSPALTKEATHSNHKASHSLAKSNRRVTTTRSRRTGHGYARHHRASRSQGPTVEPVPEEIFPPGHKFTPEEKEEASEIGALEQNGLWKEAFKAATKAGKQHPERWWLQAARAAAASNLNRPKDVIDAVNARFRTMAETRTV